MTGGLAYHWRALKYRGGIWAPFRAEVSRWLESWQPQERSLLLVGPSAGHCLPGRDWFARFDRVDAVDPDRLARLWLPARLGRSIQWNSRDYLSPTQGEFRSAGARELLELYPSHAILFCNLLGQLRFLDQNAALGASFANWKRQLGELLRDRAWASFHDRLSGDVGPRGVASPESASDSAFLGQSDQELSADELLTRFYPVHERAVLLDHLTGEFFPGRPRSYFSWQIRPGCFHLVEAICGESQR